MLWEYSSDRKKIYVDIPDIGRYTIKLVNVYESILLLNGKPTLHKGKTEYLMRVVERIVKEKKNRTAPWFTYDD